MLTANRKHMFLNAVISRLGVKCIGNKIITSFTTKSDE